MYKITRKIEVNAPVEVCYQIWTNFEAFPRFMHKLISVTPVAGQENLWHWEMKGPLNSKNVSWDAVVDMMIPNKIISWHSINGQNVDTSGSVNFQPLGPNQTKVEVSMSYAAPGGLLGEFVAELVENPRDMLEEDLENFKRFAESRESALVEPSGLGTIHERKEI